MLSDAQLSANVPRLNAAATFTGPVQFTHPSNAFAGSGAQLRDVALATVNAYGAIRVAPPAFDVAFTVGVSNKGPCGLAVADVNGDGRPDLISANQGGGTVSVLTNTGHGDFVLASWPVVGRRPIGVTATDVNRDGHTDLITANSGTNTLSVLTNDGHGGFALASSPTVGSGPYAVVAVDANEDGHVDLACVNSASNSVSVLRKDVSGNFGLAATVAVGSSPSGLVATDVNGDAHVDLVTANSGASSFSVLTNDGRGLFALASSPAAGTRPKAVVAADANDDGRPDLFAVGTSGPGAHKLVVLTNDGHGGFALSATADVGVDPQAVAVADLNQDGHMDVVTANYGAATLSVLTNTGHGGFALATNLIAGNSLRAVLAVDLNGDGLVDIVAANEMDNSLSVFWVRAAVSFQGEFSGRVAGTSAGDGAGLTNLSSQHLTGPLPDTLLSTNVALLHAAQVFTGANTFSHPSNNFSGSGAGLTGVIPPDDSVGTIKLMNNAVTSAKLADNAVTTAKLADTSITAAKLAANAVTRAKLANNAVGNTELLSDAGSLDRVTGGLMWIYQGNVGLGVPMGAGLPDRPLTIQAKGAASDWLSLRDTNGVVRWHVDHLQGGLNFAQSAGLGPLFLAKDANAVGLGTTNPDAPLTLQARGDASPWLTFKDPAGTTRWQIHNSMGGLSFSLAGVAAGHLDLSSNGYVYVGGVLVAGMGRVGIGRTALTNILEVEGNASKMWAGGWAANSDRRIKTDIATVTSALDTLARVRLVSFRYTDAYRAAHPSVQDRRYLNVVAQEFQEVFPDYVQSSGEKLDGADLLQVDAYPLTIYAAAAVQELNQKVKEKDSEIQDLKKRLEKLERLLTTLAENGGGK